MGIFSFLGFKPIQVEGNAYNYSFRKTSGEELPLSAYKGKVLLIVNTASECGFTRQYADLQKLYEEYQPRGLEIIAVPSNDFGGQEPGSNEEIKNFCNLKFNITFPLAAKEAVVGENAHPFYQYAAKVLGFGTRPKWNFHKYLIDSKGNLVDHFHSTTNPQSDRLKTSIESILPQVV